MKNTDKTFTKIGENLYKLHGKKAKDYVGSVVRQKYAQMQAELPAIDDRITQLEEEIPKTEKDLETEKGPRRISDERAKSGLRWAKIGLVVAIPLAAISAVLIYQSLAPSFYGREYQAALLAAGAGLLLILGAEMLLQYLSKILTPRQLNIFIIATTLLMFTSAMGGAIFFHRSRSLQYELQQQSEKSLIGQSEEDFLNVEEIKKQIDRFNTRGMILLFAGLEWLAGLFLFRALKSYRENRPIVSLIEKRDSLSARRSELKTRKAYIKGLTTDQIGGEIMTGVNNSGRGGSIVLLVVAIATILGMMLLFFLLAENAFGKSLPSKYYLLALDRTGSTEHDRLENERAVLKIIDSLQPGDKIDILLVTEATFSNPEYMISAEMPSKAGYFKEQLRRAKIHLMNEFRRLAEKLSNERPATALIDGIWMFARMCSENRGRERNLILLSDMRQFTKEIDEDMITQDVDAAFSRVKSEGLIPDMKGINVYAMGISTAGLTVQKWRKLEMFWRKFFNAARANLKCYDMGRHWPQE